MSHYWGLSCETCKIDSPCWFNHGEDIILHAIRNWKAIAQLRKVGGFDIDTQPSSNCEEPGLIQFVAWHHAHKGLALKDEYGHARPIPEDVLAQGGLATCGG
jgi:hypothetical protein